MTLRLLRDSRFNIDDIIKILVIKVARVYYIHLLIKYIGIHSGSKLTL